MQKGILYSAVVHAERYRKAHAATSAVPGRQSTESIECHLPVQLLAPPQAGSFCRAHAASHSWLHPWGLTHNRRTTHIFARKITDQGAVTRMHMGETDRPLFAMQSVLVMLGLICEGPQTGWLKAMEIYSLKFLVSRDLKSRR